MEYKVSFNLPGEIYIEADSEEEAIEQAMEMADYDEYISTEPVDFVVECL